MTFKVTGEGRYHLADPTSGIEFEADHLRRDTRSGELSGELTVSAGLLGTKIYDGVLSKGTFNFSSVQARSTRAKLLVERAKTGHRIDFLAMLEVFCQRIATHERDGTPAVVLRDVPLTTTSVRSFDWLGLRFPCDHLSMLFGAGDSLKSFLALGAAGHLATQEPDTRVLYVDWELSAEDHKRRLAAIYGPTAMPPGVRYKRAMRPLLHEVDCLRRIVVADRIRYVVLDSVAYGTQGDPAEAAAAMDFCRGVGQLGVGALAIAHITKNGEQNDRMPYGSVFWHNSSRMTWNIKRTDEEDTDDAAAQLGAFNRKSNLGPKRPAVGLKVGFSGDRVTFTPTDLAASEELAAKLPLWQRITRVVRSGPQTLATIAEELDYDNVDSLERIVRKHKERFTRVTGSDGIHRIALVTRRAS
jgi:hypothetical protein